MMMRSFLLVSALAWVVLVPGPAFSQPSQDSPSSAQYDQYGDLPVPGVGGQAVQDAIVASGALRASAEEAQAADAGAVSAVERPYATDGQDLVSTGTAEVQSAASSETAEVQSEASSGTAEVQSAAPSDLEKLPDTGGPPTWWLGAPLLCAGGLLARKILP